jgi:four helix bundle protein
MEDLGIRTKRFAIEVVRLVDRLLKRDSLRVIGNQLLRSATSVGANYRAARRGKSRADFFYKLKIVEEEIDECQYWMELLMESGLMEKSTIEPLYNESKELTAIFVSSNKRNKTVKYKA